VEEKFFTKMTPGALSRTLTLSSLMSTSVTVEEWKRIFDKLDLVS
jgi:hypothetical protein